MPYPHRSDLPESVRSRLPGHAQNIYKDAFNSAWKTYADAGKRRGGASREAVAHKVAWSAVETQYRKEEDGEWRRK